MRLSIIIPTFQEAALIGRCVRHALPVADEVLVVDASSGDGTAERAAKAGARVLRDVRKGRGPQLNAGALAATGDVLLFLHADARLRGDARGAIAHALTDPGCAGGNFLLRFVQDTQEAGQRHQQRQDAHARWARLFSAVNDWRRRIFRIYYGDSAIFVRTTVFSALGGFEEVPIMEDYAFVRRLEQQHRTAYCRQVVVEVSARRFAAQPARTMFLWGAIQTGFSLGVSPHLLARFYHDVRAL